MMNWLDIVILVAIAVCTFLGFRTGLIGAVLSLAGLIVGIILAGRYYIVFSEQLSFISQASIAKIVAFIIILVAVLIIARVLAWLLKRIISVLMLGWVNRIGGAVFGLVLGALFCAALLATWIKYMGIVDTIVDSRLAIVLLDQLPMVLALLPEEFDAIRSFFR